MSRRTCARCAVAHFWFATSDQGAYRWDGKDFHQLTTADGLPTNNVSLHMEDRHGNLWLSCFHWHLTSGEKRGALCMWDGQTVTTFPDVPGLTENEIYSVTEDRNGHIWICATRHGVYRYDGSTFTSFTQTQPERPTSVSDAIPSMRTARAACGSVLLVASTGWKGRPS